MYVANKCPVPILRKRDIPKWFYLTVKLRVLILALLDRVVVRLFFLPVCSVIVIAVGYSNSIIAHGCNIRSVTVE